MRAIIVDDEPLARQYLRALLGRIGGVEVAGEAADATSCLDLVELEKPDVVFLDIRLPGMSGMELAQIINGMENSPKVVFVTGYDEYAVHAFDLEAVDYITKPFSEERLQRTVDRLMKAKSSTKSMTVMGRHDSASATPLVCTKLAVKQDTGWKLIPIKDIVYVNTEGKRVRIQTVTESFLCNYTIAYLEQRLGNNGFFRANEGCLVNLDYIAEVISREPRYYDLTMNDSKHTSIPLSRSKAQKLREILRLR